MVALATILAPARALAEPVLVLGSAQGEGGGTVTVPLSVTGNTGGLGGINAHILLPGQFSLAGVTAGELLAAGDVTIAHHEDATTGSVHVIAYSGGSLISGDGVLLDLAVAISSSASPGNYDLGFSQTNDNPLINSRHALSNGSGSVSLSHSLRSGHIRVGPEGEIPTLTEWGTLILAGILAWAAARASRRRALAGQGQAPPGFRARGSAGLFPSRASRRHPRC
jgi:hypothetical protein